MLMYSLRLDSGVWSTAFTYKDMQYPNKYHHQLKSRRPIHRHLRERAYQQTQAINICHSTKSANQTTFHTKNRYHCTTSSGSSANLDVESSPGTSVGGVKFANFNKNSYLYNFTVVAVVVVACSNATLDLESSPKHPWLDVGTTGPVQCWGEVIRVRLKRERNHPLLSYWTKYYFMTACGG
jgi:hypothetical protein